MTNEVKSVNATLGMSEPEIVEAPAEPTEEANETIQPTAEQQVLIQEHQQLMARHEQMTGVFVCDRSRLQGLTDAIQSIEARIKEIQEALGVNNAKS